jgi:hypothetical protein
MYIYKGADGLITAEANKSFGRYHHELVETKLPISRSRKHLNLSKSHYTESIRIYKKIHGPLHPCTVIVEQLLTVVLRKLSEL